MAYRAGAEDKGTFRRLFWRLMRRCRAPRSRAPVWVRLSFTFPHFWAAQGGVLWSTGGIRVPGKTVSPDH